MDHTQRIPVQFILKSRLDQIGASKSTEIQTFIMEAKKSNSPVDTPAAATENDAQLPTGLSTEQRDNFVKLLAKFISHRETEKKRSSEDTLFDMFVNEETDLIAIGKFLSALRTFGLRTTDPRLKEMMQNLQSLTKPGEGSPETLNLTRETFK